MIITYTYMTHNIHPHDIQNTQKQYIQMIFTNMIYNIH